MSGNIVRGNETKPHIVIVGRCNSGKSTLMNCLVGASSAIVSPVAGTTTDAVRRNCEIRGLGAAVVVDTAGVDDGSLLGRQRMVATNAAVLDADILIVLFSGDSFSLYEQALVDSAKGKNVPFLVVYNSKDGAVLPEQQMAKTEAACGFLPLFFDGTAHSLAPIYDRIGALAKDIRYAASLFGDRVQKGDVVLLVCPIDSAAPVGRMILPQIQALRELLDRGALGVVVQPAEIERALKMVGCPRMVVVDSQVLAEVSPLFSEEVELTTFSILLSHSKGDVSLYKEGLEAIDGLKAGDKVLVMESCLHQTSCEDIGRVKLPGWLDKYVGGALEYHFLCGRVPLPDDVKTYKFALQCGGCMATATHIRRRLGLLKELAIPVTNYGMAIKKITAR